MGIPVDVAREAGFLGFMELRDHFIENAKEYAKDKKLTHKDFVAMGIPASIVEEAGIEISETASEKWGGPPQIGIEPQADS